MSDAKESIRWQVEDYVTRGGPITVSLTTEDDEGNEVERDSFAFSPSEDLPADILRRLTANGIERIASGRVSQFSKQGNAYRFEQLKTNVFPLWYDGVWRPRKRSRKLEIQAVAEWSGYSYNAIAKQAEAAPEKFQQVLQREEVQEKLQELLDAETKPQEVSLDDLL